MQDQEKVILQNLPLDKDLYRAITQSAYKTGEKVESIVNGMLREHLYIFSQFRRMGCVVIADETVKMTFAELSEETIARIGRKMSNKAKEVLLMMNQKPATLDGCVHLLKALSTANAYDLDVQKKDDAASATIIVKHDLGAKYSYYLEELIRATLEDVATINRFETTDSLVFIDCSVKK